MLEQLSKEEDTTREDEDLNDLRITKECCCMERSTLLCVLNQRRRNDTSS